MKCHHVQIFEEMMNHTEYTNTAEQLNEDRRRMLIEEVAIKG